MTPLETIIRPISREYADFRKRFQSFAETDNPLLLEVLRHVVQRNGKQMRPILTMLFARLFGTVNEATFNAAMSLELLHTASLVHDDVVDDSDERRGQPSVNALFGNKVSVLAGDFLLATSLSYMALTEDGEMSRVVASLAQTLADGELLQLSCSRESMLSEDVYYTIIQKKTASLFSACARLGAMSVKASEEQIEASARFGDYVGRCFQIRDDIFDYFDSSNIGKPTGNDIREGKITLPLLYAIRQCGTDDIRALIKRSENANLSDENVKKLISFAKQNGGIEYAEQAMENIRKQALALLPPDADKEVLESLITYLDTVINRKS
ncbi:MAG: polyprenyl synthetase family protein [Bacteroidaceae bacterium]|nr:polyprenyl synthetase family protein [Bacteroidaceae bacterium]